MYQLLLLCIAFLIQRPSWGFLRSFSPPSRVVQRLFAGSHVKHDLVLWDCDGVLVDSEALLKQGEVEALARAGIEMSVDDCVRLFSGVSVDEADKNFLKDKGKDLPPNFFKDQIAG